MPRLIVQMARHDAILDRREPRLLLAADRHRVRAARMEAAA